MVWGTSGPGLARIPSMNVLGALALERDPGLGVPAPGLGLVQAPAQVGADALGDVGLVDVDARALAGRPVPLDGGAEAKLGGVEVRRALGLLLGRPVGPVRLGVGGAGISRRVVEARLDVGDSRRGLWRVAAASGGDDEGGEEHGAEHGAENE